MKRLDIRGARSVQVSATIDSGDDFSHQSTQVIDNYDNFDQTIMGIEAFQTEEHLNRVLQPEMEPGAQTEVTFPQDFTPHLKPSLKAGSFSVLLSCRVIDYINIS